MNWRVFAEKELAFYFRKADYIEEIKQLLKELENDVSYPSIYVDDVLGRICFHIPTVEEEVIRREERRESLRMALERMQRAAKTIKNALDRLTPAERAIMSRHCEGIKNSPEYKRALFSFYCSLIVVRSRKRKSKIYEWKIAHLNQMGLDNSPKAKKLITLSEGESLL